MGEGLERSGFAILEKYSRLLQEDSSILLLLSYVEDNKCISKTRRLCHAYLISCWVKVPTVKYNYCGGVKWLTFGSLPKDIGFDSRLSQ